MTDPFDAPGTDPGATEDLVAPLRRLVPWQAGFGVVAVAWAGWRVVRHVTTLARGPSPFGSVEDAVIALAAASGTLSPSGAVLAVGAMALFTAFHVKRLDLAAPDGVLRGLRAQRRLWMVTAMASVGALCMWALVITLLLAAEALA